MTIRELRQRRANLVSQARALVDAADNGKRDMTQEETNQYDALMAQVTQMGADIQRRDQLASVESDLEAPVTETQRPEVEQRDEKPEERGTKSAEYRSAYTSYLRNGAQGLSIGEVRALQADNQQLGGALVPPVQFVNELIQAVDDAVYMRQWATVYQVQGAESLGAPSLEADPADPTWTSELGTGTEDSTMAFGKRELHPYPLAKRIKVSRKLLNKVPNVEALVRERFAYKFAVTMEKGYLTGNGANQPLGVFTASADGVSTARDVSTGNTTTTITFDGLKSAKYTLKGNYWPNARWIFHRDAVAMIAKLKDGDGRYLWQDSQRDDEPDRLLGKPVAMSEYAPNTFTSQLYVGILGDFRAGYWIADAMNMEVQRLVELYAEANQVGMIGRMESDGMPVLAEAFVRVKLA